MKIEIKSIPERRWRAGLCFTQIPRFFDEDDLPLEVWKLIKSDALLSVREVEDDEVKDHPALEGEEAEIALIGAAIRRLTPEQFDGSGLPRMPDLRTILGSTSPDLAARLDMATRDRVFATMKKDDFVAPLDPGAERREASRIDEAVSSSDDLDVLIENAIRSFGPGDFTKEGEPRMSELSEAVQKLAYPDGGGGGILIKSEDRDRVFRKMTAAEFEVPRAKPEGGT